MEWTLSLCIFDHKKDELFFAGANNSALLLRKGNKPFELYVDGSLYPSGSLRLLTKESIPGCSLLTIAADSMPIGKYSDDVLNFTLKKIKLEPGDKIYLHSDGIVDQFGGPEGKKFKSSRLKDNLLALADIPIREQKAILENLFETWKGNEEQTDDVLIIGFEL